MDHDQEKFYTDEELDSREDVQPEEEQEIDDMSYFLELLKLLRTAIECGSRIPLSSKVVIDANNCLKIVDDLESNLPDAVQYGMQMYSERKRIMGDAEETAISRVTSAEMRANAVLMAFNLLPALPLLLLMNGRHLIRPGSHIPVGLLLPLAGKGKGAPVVRLLGNAFS